MTDEKELRAKYATWFTSKYGYTVDPIAYSTIWEAWQAAYCVAQREQRIEVATSQLDQFFRMKRERPIDPIYWDAHEEDRLRAAIRAAEGGEG